jgi:hypothetical protein
VANMSNVLIFNNIFSFDNTNSIGSFMLNAPVYGGNSRDIRIFNNTFAADANTIGEEGFQWSIWFQGAITNVWVYNNIFSNCRNILAIDAGDPSQFANINVDYNVMTPVRQFYFYLGTDNASQRQAWLDAGFDPHGILTTNVCFVRLPNGVTGYPDWRLQTNSPALGVGTNLSAYFTTDYAGGSRPLTGPWTLGAYEGGTNSPAPGITNVAVMILSGQATIQVMRSGN